MSFRLFAYYCAICGGAAAFVGFVFGWIFTPPIGESSAFIRVAVLGTALGLSVALGLSLLDSVWVCGLSRYFAILARVAVAIVVGALGGLLGGLLGQFLFEKTTSLTFFVVGWTLTGSLVGVSISSFEVLSSLVKGKDFKSAKSKLLKCLIGGTVGGLLGGLVALMIRLNFPKLFPNKSIDWLWSPTGVGFVVVGACIGLFVGLAQIILKDAWVKVEAGFRAGREMILAKESTSVGRAESCDIGLFGDPGIEKLHACIIMRGNSYVLEDVNTPGGTYVNDVKVVGPTPLKSGDLIRLGKSVLRFFEKAKK
jgi:FHA domain